MGESHLNFEAGYNMARRFLSYLEMWIDAFLNNVMLNMVNTPEFNTHLKVKEQMWLRLLPLDDSCGRSSLPEGS